MGADAAATVNAIEATRDRLEHDLDVLDARLPDRQEATRAAAISAGTVAAALGSVWLGWSRYRRTKERRELASLLHDAGVEAVADGPATTSGGPWKVLLGLVTAGAVGAAGYVATRDIVTNDDHVWSER